MKIGEFLDSRAIIVDLKASNKKEALEELSEVLVSVYRDLDRDKMVHALQEREKLGSTGIGDGVAIPHGKLEGLGQLISCFGKSERGVEFQSMDKKLAHLFFLLFAPENSAGVHLKALAKISRLLKRPSFRKELLQTKSKEEIYEILTREDAQEFHSIGDQP